MRYICVIIYSIGEYKKERVILMNNLDKWEDLNLDSPSNMVIGFDWKGEELYGYESGFLIDGEFVCEDDILLYIEKNHDIVLSIDVL